jgi:hypothetical protein
VIDQEHSTAFANLRRRRAGGGRCLSSADRGEHRSGLQAGLGFLRLRVAVVKQCRAGANFGDPVLHADGAQGQAGVHVAVEGHPPDRAAVPAAR